MKIIEISGFPAVYFVDPETRVSIKGTEKRHTIHRFGYHGRIEDFDFERYEESFEVDGHPPSARELGECKKTPYTAPGIEVIANNALFENGALGYYALMDGFGLDNKNISQRLATQKTRKKKRSKTNTYLNRLYNAPTRKAYEKKLVAELDSIHEQAARIFEVRVLGVREVYRAPFNEVNLHEALGRGIHIDIDPILADKFLALYTQLN